MVTHVTDTLLRPAFLHLGGDDLRTLKAEPLRAQKAFDVFELRVPSGRCAPVREALVEW